MRIIDLLNPKSIQLHGQAMDKRDALDKMVDLMAASGKINDVEKYRKGVYKREEEGTTGIGEGIAIPHCKSDAVNEPGLAAMVVPKGVDFESLDGKPVELVLLIAAPNTKDNVHLSVLSKLSVLLMNKDFSNKLKNAKTIKEFIRIIDEADKNKEDVNVTKEEQEKNANDSKGFIIAVTACPTGIAHTYMAAEAIEQKAKKMGYDVKVETRGSGGAKNVLTTDDIERASGIIVAADTKVPMERFAGKKVVVSKVADGINKAEKLIEDAVSGKAPVFQGTGESFETGSANSQSMGANVYKHLMSGVSHMLPFVIGGGILVALAFLIDTLAGYGSTGGGDFGNMTAAASLLKYVGGLAMGLMVPVLAGYIAYSIADRPGLAVGFLGGMIASSGNAALFAGDGAAFPWVGNTTGFSRFIENYAFQGNGGNTVSGFLGGILAGFLAGAIILMLKKICSGLPESLEGIKPTLIYPLVGMFILAILMCFIFNPLIGSLNTLLSRGLNALYDANLILLLGLILGAMMAIDMGGPINKAAYVFGTGMLAQAAADPSIATAAYISMAAVMVGGMVPPTGIAIACKLFPKKFTKEEQGSFVSNLVMGSSFITEGAIPFAAADPLHVIPCTMVGAGVAGLISALFRCTLMAPHGGIFVFATVGNPFMYILAWIVGSAITAVMLGFIKRNID